MKSYRSFATIVLAILLVISPLFACGKIPKAEILKSELPAQDRLIITPFPEAPVSSLPER